jgi:hypothetical protein
MSDPKGSLCNNGIKPLLIAKKHGLLGKLKSDLVKHQIGTNQVVRGKPSINI